MSALILTFAACTPEDEPPTTDPCDAVTPEILGLHEQQAWSDREVVPLAEGGPLHIGVLTAVGTYHLHLAVDFQAPTGTYLVSKELIWNGEGVGWSPAMATETVESCTIRSDPHYGYLTLGHVPCDELWALDETPVTVRVLIEDHVAGEPASISLSKDFELIATVLEHEQCPRP